MRGVIFVVLLVVTCFYAEAQGKLKHLNIIRVGDEVPDEVPYNDDDYTEPTFPGGLKQFYKYLAKNIHYPKNAVKNHIQGKVYLIFVIEKDGSIGNIKVKKGVSKERLRSAQSTEKFTQVDTGHSSWEAGACSLSYSDEF